MNLYETWLHSNLAGRDEMAKKYGISKQFPIHVVDNVLKSDGYNPQEVIQKLSAGEVPTVKVPDVVSPKEVKKIVKEIKKKK